MSIVTDRIAMASPAAYTRDLIAEIIWWHNATGNHVTVEQIFARGRHGYITSARADCIRRIRQVRGWSYPRLATYFGLDHTSTLHHCHKTIVAKGRVYYSPDVQSKNQRFNAQRAAKMLLLPPKPRGNRRRDAAGNIIRRKDRANGMAQTGRKGDDNGNTTPHDAIKP